MFVTVSLADSAFVSSSRLELPSSRLIGYGFVGADYICGDPGHRLYQQVRGRSIEPGEDGCYVSITRHGSAVEFGTDYSGHARLFYYSDGRDWAVSNSLVLLVRHLRESHITLSVDDAQLAALHGGPPFTTQMSSFTTIFRNVRLLPSRARLVVSAGRVQLVRLPQRPALGYDEALARFISTWIARLATMISDGRIELTSDITGGVDSRTVLALVRAALDATGAARDRVAFRSTDNDIYAKDLAVARSLSERFRLSLNSPSRAGNPLLTGHEAFEAWKRTSLGVYLPVYMHREVLNPFQVRLQGAGGECHRPFYPAGPVDALLASAGKTLSTDHFESWRADVLEALEYLMVDSRGISPMVLHYREFRHRLHSGRACQYGVVLTPLASNLLDAASDHVEKLATGQINFDVMETLVPGLMNHRYDDARKAPDERVRANLTTLDVPTSIRLGGVFAAAPDPVVNREVTPSAIQLFAEAYRRAADSERVREAFDQAALQEGEAMVEAALRRDRFRHAFDAKGLSRVLIAHFAFEAGD